MIEVKNLSVGYQGRAVLTDVNLQFPQGTVTALLGPNGCGKSSLLKTALGLLPPMAGEILVDGRPLSQLAPGEMARKAAYLSQSRNIPRITVRRMVLHGRFPYLSYPRKYRPEDYAAVKAALERVDALELADRQLDELSGGQRQKVYLAMALAQDTGTIFMDEPTTYLDVRHQLEVMEVAESLAREGRAVVLVLHDLSLALRSAHQVAVLSQGRLMAWGSPEQVYESGVLNTVFGVCVHRVSTENGFQYFCQMERGD